MMEPVFLFPGQGAYFGDALGRLCHDNLEVETVLAEIDASVRPLTGQSVSSTLLSPTAPGIDELLDSAPELLQLGIFATSVAIYRILRRRGMVPSILLGHSLGEISAMVCAGAFSVSDGALIVHHRSEALRAAGIADGYMAATGLDVARAEALVKLVDDPDTVVAVENGPAQTVLSGRSAALDTAGGIARGMKVGFTRLKSPYPFHSPLLSSAAEAFHKQIADIPQGALGLPVYSPIIGRFYTDADDLAQLLSGHFAQRVRFSSAIRAMHEQGARVLVECGSGEALSRAAAGTLRAGDTTAVSAWPTELADVELTHLVTAGVLAPGRDGTDGVGFAGSARTDTAALHRALLPAVSTMDFTRFWAKYGPKLQAQARRHYDDLPGSFDDLPGSFDDLQVTASRNGLDGAVGTGSARDRTAVLRGLVEVYAQALEYPPEVFGADVELEAELGVDSVKQTELLGKVSAEHGLPPRPADFRMSDYNTLGRIADLICTAR